MNQRIVRSVEAEAYDTYIIMNYADSAAVPEFIDEAGILQARLRKPMSAANKKELEYFTVPLAGKLVNVILLSLIGLPEQKNSIILQRMSTVFKKCKEIAAERILVYAEGFSMDEGSAYHLRGIFEAGGLTDYCFDWYKAEKTYITIKSIDFFGFGGHAEEALKEAEYCVSGIKLARRLINEPANSLTPGKLAEETVIAGRESGFKVTVLEEEAVKKLGMDAFLAVGNGSEYRPVFIVMEYEGNAESSSKIGIAGKGLTFDTGGYCIKSDYSMERMYNDMGGAAALIGALTAISTMKLKINIVGVIAACENKISGASVVPGNIVKSMSGKYIEINNTDAEGRLTLADAISYMVKFHKVDRVIDIATLTESVHTALGSTIAGIFTDSEVLRKAVNAAALKYGEKVWELPIDEDLRPVLNSDFADIKNSSMGSKMGGHASIAALFIKEFAQNTPWLHIDIGGVNWEEQGSNRYPFGGRGFGVKLLIGLAKELCEYGFRL